MDLVDQLFSIGTGWLGWSPDVVMNTPIPQLVLAMEGKLDFTAKTNPFGGPAKKKAEAPKPERKPPTMTTAQQLAAFDAMRTEARMKHKARRDKEQK